MRSSKIPKVSIEPKSIVIKVQVPTSPNKDPKGEMLVYTKKRDEFTCTIRRIDGFDAYDSLYQTVKNKGVGGLKAYFSAMLHDKDKLVVKISEVLAPQPF